MVMMTFSAAFAPAVAVMVTAAATAACQMFDQMLYLILSGFTVLNDRSGEVQRLACQRMVRVDGYTVFLDFLDLRHELVVFIVLKRDDSPLEDVLVVEVAVDCENIAAKLMYTRRLIFAESFGRLEFEIECRAFL